MIRTMIVDDEKYIREELIYSLEKHKNIKICCETGDGEEVLDFIKTYEPDVVFLDIHLQTENGLSLALKIKQLKEPPYLVLATAYSEYALEGFEVGAVDYLVKPFDQKRIDKCVERIRALEHDKHSVSQNDLVNDDLKKIAVQMDGKFFLIDLDSIIYLEFRNNNLYLYTEKKEFICANLNLKKFLETYKNNKFIRVHKSFIVNIDYISEIIPWFNSTMKIKLKNMADKEIFVSRNYIKEFKAIVNI
ncbi:MAG: LytTR family DNA-binding domain-containing protein [Bacillota bacterium]|nr:LytTR family DNA-binding domain-containing protein [Bacillota bacterium]